MFVQRKHEFASAWWLASQSDLCAFVVSIFALVARSKMAATAAASTAIESPPSFVLLDVVAVDARGDVAFPPFRIQRFVEKACEC